MPQQTGGFVQLGPGLHFYGNSPNSGRYGWTHHSSHTQTVAPSFSRWPNKQRSIFVQLDPGVHTFSAQPWVHRPHPQVDDNSPIECSEHAAAFDDTSISSGDSEISPPMEPSILVVGDCRKPVLRAQFHDRKTSVRRSLFQDEPPATPSHDTRLCPPTPPCAVDVCDQTQSCHFGMDDAEMAEIEWMCEFE